MSLLSTAARTVADWVRLGFPEEVAKRMAAGGVAAAAATQSDDAEAGVWGAPVKDIIKRMANNESLLFHSGTADQAESLTESIEPQHGDWVRSIAAGSDIDDPDNYLQSLPEAAWYSESPSWVKGKISQKLNKPVSDVTDADVENYGHLSIIDPSTAWEGGAEFGAFQRMG